MSNHRHDRLVADLAALSPAPSELWHFGSSARPGSCGARDVDIAVVYPSLSEAERGAGSLRRLFPHAMVEMGEYSSEHDQKLHLICLSAADRTCLGRALLRSARSGVALSLKALSEGAAA